MAMTPEMTIDAGKYGYPPSLERITGIGFTKLWTDVHAFSNYCCGDPKGYLLWWPGQHAARLHFVFPDVAWEHINDVYWKPFTPGLNTGIDVVGETK